MMSILLREICLDKETERVKEFKTWDQIDFFLGQFDGYSWLSRRSVLRSQDSVPYFIWKIDDEIIPHVFNRRAIVLNVKKAHSTHHRDRSEIVKCLNKLNKKYRSFMQIPVGDKDFEHLKDLLRIYERRS